MRVDRVVGSVEQSLGRVITALANNLTSIENFQAKLITVADTGTADVEFTVTHNLGVVPSFYIWNIDQAGIVYDSRRVDWTTEQIFLKCDVGNAVLTLLVMK